MNLKEIVRSIAATMDPAHPMASCISGQTPEKIDTTRAHHFLDGVTHAAGTLAISYACRSFIIIHMVFASSRPAFLSIDKLFWRDGR